MLTPSAPQFRRRSGRVKPQATTAPPPPSVVTVVKVTTTQDGNGRWYFSSPVTSFPDPEQVAGLVCDNLSPIAFIIIGPEGWIEFQYPGYIGEGSSWAADDSYGTIDLTFESGLPLALPEGGEVGPE